MGLSAHCSRGVAIGQSPAPQKGAAKGDQRLQLLPGLAALAHYDRRWLPRDLLAGLSVAAVALPVGIAYADLAGVPPIIGLYSAIFPLLAYAVFGSSRQLIIGPDAATCLLVAASLAALAQGDAPRYLALLPALTLLTAVVYLAAGAGRFGFIANFFSQPILIGYLNGIALMIIVGQLSKLLGYRGATHEFLEQLQEFAGNLRNIHQPTLWLSVAEVVGLLLLRRFAPTVPAALVGVAAGVLAVAILDLPARGVAVTGPLPGGLPTPRLPGVGPDAYRGLLRDAAAIMLVSFASGMLTAKSFAARNHYSVSANQELVALGFANIVAGLVQGFPVTGADSRTAVNNAVGGKSQLVGVFAAIAMLLVLLYAGGLLALVPTAALAAVVLVSALAMIDIAGVLQLTHMRRGEGLLSIGTTLGVLILGVVPGVALAIALSLTWLVIAASRPNIAVLGRVARLDGFHSTTDYPDARTVPGLLIFRFESALLFFNIDYFAERLHAAIAAEATPVSWVIIDASPCNALDATALEHLASLRHELGARGITLGYAGVRQSVYRTFNTGWLAQQLRGYGIAEYPTLDAATRAFEEQRASATNP
jgi:high affinity sulfate transporter 1